MLTLSPINVNIQNTLKEKMGMLKKMSGATSELTRRALAGKWRNVSFLDEYTIGTPLTESTGDILKNYMFARTPFLRMTSFSPQTEDKFATVLMGGDLRGGSTNYPMNRLRAGFEDYKADVGSTITGNANDPFINYLGLYTQPDKTIIDDIPYRPTAGLKDISVEYKGGGMRLGSTRTAEISWTCWTWQELENYRPHFLHHGKTVLLEWGWSGDGISWEGNTPFIDIFHGNTLKIDENKIVNLNQGLLDHVLSQKGHYDAMLGLIQDFTWTVNADGGFDCTTKLISQGITLFQKSQRRNTIQSTASLPLLAGETAKAWGRWNPFVDDTEITFTGGKTVEALAPYISIQEYMNDFPQQLYQYLLDVSAKDSKDGLQPIPGSTWNEIREDHLKAHGMRVICVDKFRWKELEHTEVSFVNTQRYEIYQNGVPTGTFKTEELTIPIVRTEIGNDKELYFGRFHHSERRANTLGTAQAIADSKLGYLDGNQNYSDRINASFKGYNQTNHFCTWGWFEDNVLSRFFGTVGEVEGLGDKLIGEFRSIEPTLDSNGNLVKMTQGVADAMGGEVGQQLYESTKMTNSKFLVTSDSSKWIIPNVNDPFFTNIILSIGQKDAYLQKEHVLFAKKSDETAGRIRNIYFNANYLRQKFKDSSGDIVSSVMSVWEDFSNQYGGIYKFKVEIADDGQRAMVVEEGYTGVSVDDSITDTAKKSKVFEFPVWKTDSIVKSQTITARVPKRMQLAAMYGAVSREDGKDKEGTQTVSNKYDDLVAKAWGRYVEALPSDTTGMSPDQIKNQRYKDMLIGNIDTPHRKNRYFGQAKADENQKIFLGELPKKQSATPNIKGVKIYDSILNELREVQKQELFAKMKEIADLEVDEDEGRFDATSQKALTVNREEEKMFINISSLADASSKANDEWFRFYTFTEDESDSSRCPKLRPGFHSQLQSLLRGHRAGVLTNVDPLLPIDFELEVDGIAGIFPGNSFHSSYLPERYRNESIFQAVGVSHKIDSSGWITSIKGQIRAESLGVKLKREKARKRALEAAKQARKAKKAAERQALDELKKKQKKKKRKDNLSDLSDGASLSYYMNIPDEVLLRGKWKVGDVVGKRLTHPYLIDKRSLFIMQRMRGMILKDGRMDVNSEAFKGALNFLASLPAPLPSSNASTGATKTLYGQYTTILYNKYVELGGG